MSKLLNDAIKALSAKVNVSTGILHPLDDSLAKGLFKALSANGERLTFNEVELLALENKWPRNHAKSLATLAEKIGNKRRVVIKHPSGWGEDTVLKLKAAIV
ncbi:DUF1889 family protein [Microvirgula aerodenitrificans]|uniref:DUF1889 family protein n=1 Tax=Microvirgula aerodenitrificans TaxID=57480 RepID=UPI00248EBA55|nr:DUF1889 family protein [Microvirgula aerodenitrificans]